MESVRYS